MDRRTYYIARVWSGISAARIDSTINQDFNATTRNGYIKSIPLIGDSYEKAFLKLVNGLPIEGVPISEFEVSTFCFSNSIFVFFNILCFLFKSVNNLLFIVVFFKCTFF